jgi:hypothetical protein
MFRREKKERKKENRKETTKTHWEQGSSPTVAFP